MSNRDKKITARPRAKLDAARRCAAKIAVDRVSVNEREDTTQVSTEKKKIVSRARQIHMKAMRIWEIRGGFEPSIKDAFTQAKKELQNRQLKQGIEFCKNIGNSGNELNIKSFSNVLTKPKVKNKKLSRGNDQLNRQLLRNISRNVNYNTQNIQNITNPDTLNANILPSSISDGTRNIISETKTIDVESKNIGDDDRIIISESIIVDVKNSVSNESDSIHKNKTLVHKMIPPPIIKVTNSNTSTPCFREYINLELSETSSEDSDKEFDLISLPLQTEKFLNDKERHTRFKLEQTVGKIRPVSASTHRQRKKLSNIATGSFPFVCSLCGRKFRSNVHLRVHQRTHGDKLQLWLAEAMRETNLFVMAVGLSSSNIGQIANSAFMELYQVLQQEGIVYKEDLALFTSDELWKLAQSTSLSKVQQRRFVQASTTIKNINIDMNDKLITPSTSQDDAELDRIGLQKNKNVECKAIIETQTRKKKIHQNLNIPKNGVLEKQCKQSRPESAKPRMRQSPFLSKIKVNNIHSINNSQTIQKWPWNIPISRETHAHGTIKKSIHINSNMMDMTLLQNKRSINDTNDAIHGKTDLSEKYLYPTTTSHCAIPKSYLTCELMGKECDGFPYKNPIEFINCGHHICFPCLLGMLRSGRLLRCPYCNLSSEVQRASTDFISLCKEILPSSPIDTKKLRFRVDGTVLLRKPFANEFTLYTGWAVQFVPGFNKNQRILDQITLCAFAKATNTEEKMRRLAHRLGFTWRRRK